MSDEQSELWRKMDEAFREAVEADKNLGAHAHVPRAELERHMRADHGIVAETRATPEPVSDGTPAEGLAIIALDALGEARLRVSHWRAHETGLGHREVTRD